MKKDTKKVIKGAAIGAAALIALYKFFPGKAVELLRKIPVGKEDGTAGGGGEMA